MIEKEKTDSNLGERVRDHLIKKGLLNLEYNPANTLTRGEKKDHLEKLFTNMIDILGLNLNDGNLTETPHRLARMWIDEIYSGLNWENFPKCTAIDNQFVGYDNFVLIKDIRIVSYCSHHFMPFFGLKNTTFGPGCNIAYIPNKKVLGLSKLSRVVEFLGARPNTQETLTAQICETISYIAETEDVAVYINASHTCMSLRGTKDPTANTITFYCTGRFKSDGYLRKEVLAAIQA